MLIRICSGLLFIILYMSTALFAVESETIEAEKTPKIVEPLVGSWTFSGMVTNENGERYGYFFQMQRQDSEFHTKTALIDGQTNKLILFYEESEKITQSTGLDWHVGQSFMRYNPINESWIFGVKTGKEQGFNFKVDMLKQADAEHHHDTLVLRPGVELQALQTSRLNGHIQMGEGKKEQFVTGNNAWFGKLWFSKSQNEPHDISTTFCRLSNDNGFYSANLKEPDATGAAVAGWRDALGNKVKMSQFLSVKPLSEGQCQLSLGLPKINFKVANTLKEVDGSSLSIAGFSKVVAGLSKDNPVGFCFINEQSFAKFKNPVNVLDENIVVG